MRRIFDKNCNFLLSIAKLDQFDHYYFNKLEIAFVGRSNAGKSSLLNSLVKIDNIAHVSKSPGKTKTINAYSLGNHLNLLDMPGYGYATVSKVQRAQWGSLMSDYFKARRPQLAQVYLLMDGRVGMKDSDLDFIERLPISITTFIMTKCDKMNQKEMEDVEKSISEFMIVNFSLKIPTIFTSARTGVGLDKLRSEIHGFVAK